MNFFFGQVLKQTSVDAKLNQQQWLNSTIFQGLDNNLSHYSDSNFCLTLINDPKNKCPQQSKVIHVDENYVCASDCILYNKKELAKQLNIDKHSSNETYIITAYQKWGLLFADKLDGKFSFVLWDRKKLKLIAGRDALGYCSFCYSNVNDGLYFSSDLATLLDQPGVSKDVNMKRFYQCFRYSNNTPEQTYFEHCHYCPPSHVFEYSFSSQKVVDYWQLDQKHFEQNSNDELTNAQTFISLLEESIQNETLDKPSMGLMLSGGYDSNLLAGVLSENNTWKSSICCYSYTFSKHQSCDESGYVNHTVDMLNLPLKPLNADRHFVFADMHSRAIMKDTINLDGYAALPQLIFNQASSDNKQLLITGHYGDDLFGANRYKFADLLLNYNLSSVVKFILGAPDRSAALMEFLNFGIRPLLPKWIKSIYRTLVKPQQSNSFSIKDDQINNINEQSRLKNCKLFHHKNLLKLVYYTNTAEGIYYYRKHLYLGHGLKYVMPFLSKKMIEFFWSVPIEQLNKPQAMRSLQTRALSMFDLDHIAKRNDKTEFTELFLTGLENKRTDLVKFIEKTCLNDLVKFPDPILGKLKSGSPLEISQAGVIGNYLLAAYWWQSIRHNPGSFNRLSTLEEGDEIKFNDCNLWHI